MVESSRGRVVAIIAGGLISLLSIGRVAADGVTHTVMPGDTLSGIAAIYSVTVGTIVFASNPRLTQILTHAPPAKPIPEVGVVQLVVLGLLFLSILITWVKKATRRGSLWRGGMISGHTAFGFLLATAIAIATHSLAVTALALALALLVSQSRIQARIHSPTEVLVGGILGILVGIILFLWSG